MMKVFEPLSTETERLAKIVVDAAYQVHSSLGPGLAGINLRDLPGARTEKARDCCREPGSDSGYVRWN